MKSYLVIGLGRFGAAVATTLQDLGNEVMILDENEERVQKLASSVTSAVVGDARDEELLRALGARDFDGAVVAIGANFAASILVTMTLKTMGVPQVICKAQDELQKKALEKIGADRVVIPEREMGMKLAQNLTSTSVLDYTGLGENCGIAEIRTPRAWVGKTMKQVDIRVKYGVTVAAVHKADGEVTIFLGADYIMQRSDILVLVGRNEDLARVQKL